MPSSASSRRAPQALATGRGGLVLGADTVVALDGRPLGKPRDAGEARTMLLALRDRDHEVVTGVALAMEGAAGAEAAARTRVRMRAYTDDEVAAYIATGDPFDKAGGYAIQHPHFRPVARIDGCYCNVVGLPLWTVRDLLRRLSPDLAPARPSLAIARCATCPLASAH
ncbi:MAG: Maf family protein [Dehalococcoidia bacterium]